LVSTHWHPINNFHRWYSSPIMLEFCAGVIIGNIYLERATPLSNKTALMLIAAGVVVFCAISAIADFEQSQYRTAFSGFPATLIGTGVALGPNRRNRILEPARNFLESGESLVVLYPRARRIAGTGHVDEEES
jgi:hypothetical protein